MPSNDTMMVLKVRNVKHGVVKEKRLNPKKCWTSETKSCAMNMQIHVQLQPFRSRHS